MDELAGRWGWIRSRCASGMTENDPISGKPFSLRRLKQCLRAGRRAVRLEPAHAGAGVDATMATVRLIGWGVAAGAYPGYVGTGDRQGPHERRRCRRAFRRRPRNGPRHPKGDRAGGSRAARRGSATGCRSPSAIPTCRRSMSPPGPGAANVSTPPVRDAALQIVARLAALATGRAGGTLPGSDPTRLRLRAGRLIAPDGARRKRRGHSARGRAWIMSDAEANARRPAWRRSASSRRRPARSRLPGRSFPAS